MRTSTLHRHLNSSASIISSSAFSSNVSLFFWSLWRIFTSPFLSLSISLWSNSMFKFERTLLLPRVLATELNINIRSKNSIYTANELIKPRICVVTRHEQERKTTTTTTAKLIENNVSASAHARHTQINHLFHSSWVFNILLCVFFSSHLVVSVACVCFILFLEIKWILMVSKW